MPVSTHVKQSTPAFNVGMCILQATASLLLVLLDSHEGSLVDSWSVHCNPDGCDQYQLLHKQENGRKIEKRNRYRSHISVSIQFVKPWIHPAAERKSLERRCDDVTLDMRRLTRRFSEARKIYNEREKLLKRNKGIIFKQACQFYYATLQCNTRKRALRGR